MDPKNYLIEQHKQHQHRIIKTDDEDVIDDEGLVVVEPSSCTGTDRGTDGEKFVFLQIYQGFFIRTITMYRKPTNVTVFPN